MESDARNLPVRNPRNNRPPRQAATRMKALSSTQMPAMKPVTTRAVDFPDSCADDKPGVCAGANGVSVETETARDGAALCAAVSEVEGEGVVGVAGRDEGGEVDFARGGYAEHVAVGDAQAPGGGRTDKGGVVPGELGERLGQFLEEGVVRVGAVPDVGVGFEDEVEG